MILAGVGAEKNTKNATGQIDMAHKTQGVKATENTAQRWMLQAAEIAREALCHRAKCGSLIVNNGQVIGKGFNGPPLNDEKFRRCDKQKPTTGKPGYDMTCCEHAERRAIEDARENNAEKLDGSTLYFIRVDNEGNPKRSGQPYCNGCARAALDAGISEFALWHEDKDGGIQIYPTDQYYELSWKYKYVPKS